jgi:hypothetical protein
MRAVVQVIWAGIGLAGLAGAIVFLDQRYELPVLDWLGPQLTGRIRRIPMLDSGVWLVLLLGYTYLVATLVKLRTRLKDRDAGSHEKVAAV